MNASDFAAEELAMWEAALQQQRDVEQAFECAKKELNLAACFELHHQLRSLRMRADLLLAEAVAMKCSWREREWAKLKAQ